MKKKLLLVVIVIIVGGIMEINAQSRKVLTAYFSWSGNSRNIAEQIHSQVGGDIFEIKTVNAYPKDYEPTTQAAKKEQEINARPKLAMQVNNINSYDVIFLVYPIWWGTMPMAVFTFLESYNFSGKTIAVFCAHGGSGFGQSINDIKKLLPQTIVREGLAIRGGLSSRSQNDIKTWLQKNGFIK
ncbi:MAG: NAD(P)H-dependent oxidoreductase [Elusimicrobiota bacterium]|jgi:flavodoxin|nr:NAD(P)H-dependent oxidoreductase [Elusimicrobiota bacterium]